MCLSGMCTTFLQHFLFMLQKSVIPMTDSAANTLNFGRATWHLSPMQLQKDSTPLELTKSSLKGYMAKCHQTL